MDQKDIEEASKAYREGATLQELAREHGFSHAWVKELLMRNGVEMRPRGRKKGDRSAEVKLLRERGLRLRAEGMTWEQISSEVGKCTSYIHRICR